MEGEDLFHHILHYHHYQLTPRSRDIVLEKCFAGDGKLFTLRPLVVMTDHVHLSLTPNSNDCGETPIPKIMHAIKSTSAHQINKYVGRRGRLWQDESF